MRPSTRLGPHLRNWMAASLRERNVGHPAQIASRVAAQTTPFVLVWVVLRAQHQMHGAVAEPTAQTMAQPIQWAVAVVPEHVINLNLLLLLRGWLTWIF